MSTLRRLKSSQTLETLSSDELKSPARGIFEPRCSILDQVKRGDPLGVLHPMDSPSCIVYAIRSGGYVEADEEIIYCSIARSLEKGYV